MQPEPRIHIDIFRQCAIISFVVIAAAVWISPIAAQSSARGVDGFTAYASDTSSFATLAQFPQPSRAHTIDWSAAGPPAVGAAAHPYQLLDSHIRTRHPQPAPQPYANAPSTSSYATGMDQVLDRFHAPPPEVVRNSSQSGGWSWHVLPDGLIYRSYLAGVRESRLGGVWNYERDLGWVWDISLGGRAGILRYGTDNDFQPEGWQLDVEGAAFPRLDLDEDSDMVATDFRFGVPLTYGSGRLQTKFAFYHLSSHLGDEYMVRNPMAERINFSRDVMVLGLGWFFTPNLRGYGEAGWAFHEDVAEQWEFQFGLDYSPACPTGCNGTPFFAVNTHLREEVDYGGNFVVQVGWQWRGSGSGQLFRFGVQYFNGKSEQYEFITDSESKVGLGLWYDF